MGLELNKYERMKFHRLRKSGFSSIDDAHYYYNEYFLENIQKEFMDFTYPVFPYEELVEVLRQDVKSLKVDVRYTLTMNLILNAVIVLRQKIHHEESFEKNLYRFFKGVLRHEMKRFLKKQAEKRKLIESLDETGKYKGIDSLILELEKQGHLEKIELEVYKNGKDDSDKEEGNDKYSEFYKYYKGL